MPNYARDGRAGAPAGTHGRENHRFSVNSKFVCSYKTISFEKCICSAIRRLEQNPSDLFFVRILTAL